MLLCDAILMGRNLMGEISWGRAETCAIAMAHHSLGNVEAYTSKDAAYLQLVFDWPWLKNTYECPWCEYGRSLSLAEIVWHPFDAHVMQYGNQSEYYRKISLEQLCDWIRTIEPKEIPADSGERPQSFVDEKGEKVLEEKCSGG